MKKLISIILICVLSLTMMFSSSATMYYIGDVNLDGKVTASDARTILRFSAFLERPKNDLVKTLANADRNKIITASDARLVLRMSCKLEKKVKIEIDSSPVTTTQKGTTTTKPTTEPAAESIKTTSDPSKFSEMVLPKDIVSFNTNNYVIDGTFKINGHSRDLILAVNDKGNIKLTIDTMNDEKLLNPMSILVRRTINGSKAQTYTYILCEDPTYKKYFEITKMLAGILKMQGLDITSEMDAIAAATTVTSTNVKVQSFEQNEDFDGTLMTKYVFSASNGEVEYYLEGDSLKKIVLITYDGSDNSVIEINSIRHSQTSDFSKDGYSQVSLMLGGESGFDKFQEFFAHIKQTA